MTDIENIKLRIDLVRKNKIWNTSNLDIKVDSEIDIAERNLDFDLMLNLKALIRPVLVSKRETIQFLKSGIDYDRAFTLGQNAGVKQANKYWADNFV